MFGVKDVKFVGLVALGVVGGGLLMHYGRGSIGLLQQAHDGFDGMG